MNINIKALQALAATIRVLTGEAVEKAKSGHPGLPMGAADYTALIWAYYLKFDPHEPTWPNRDRFVLSAGHGSMLLYLLLHLFGYELSLSEIKNFRQWGSLTPGHPEFGVTPGVETTSGPLGQGFANGVGIALSGKLLSERYSKELFNYNVFGLVSDGDLMEGVAAEAASLAGHLGLSNLIYFYDDNRISIGGSTSACFTESVVKRFEAYKWFVQSVDGHDIAAVKDCLERALLEKERPSLIAAHTTIGFGSPHKAGTAEVHGSPLGEEELRLTKENLNWPAGGQFLIPEDVRYFCAERVMEKQLVRQKWQADFKKWSNENPKSAKAWAAQAERGIPDVLQGDLLQTLSGYKKEATRSLSGRALQVLYKHVPWLIGGSADLEPSTKTLLKDSPEIQAGNFSGNNIRFGVREHAMGAVINGLAYCGCWIPYSATFLVFADYMRPSIRLAAMSKIQSLFLFTHDSFQVGEDGPTHQPVEHIFSLRAIPGLRVYRPADGVEVGMCYLSALRHRDGPSALLFSRQDLPELERSPSFKAEEILKGAYRISGRERDGVLIVATGSEVFLALEAAKLLRAGGVEVQVISMPCRELFLVQDRAWRESLLPKQARKISIEAGITLGWERIVGCDALMIGLEHFGASAPAGDLAEKYGFTPLAIKQRIMEWL